MEELVTAVVSEWPQQQQNFIITRDRSVFIKNAWSVDLQLIPLVTHHLKIDYLCLIIWCEQLREALSAVWSNPTSHLHQSVNLHAQLNRAVLKNVHINVATRLWLGFFQLSCKHTECVGPQNQNTSPMWNFYSVRLIKITKNNRINSKTWSESIRTLKSECVRARGADLTWWASTNTRTLTKQPATEDKEQILRLAACTKR